MNTNEKVIEKQKIRVFTKKFDNLTEVLSDNVCKKSIQKKLDGFRTKRIAGPPPGMRFKRSGFDVLEETGRLNVRYFMQVYPLIEEKKSTLPSSQRMLIEEVVVSAIRETIVAHSIVIEEGLNFRVNGSKELEVGIVKGFNPVENTITIRQRVGKKFNDTVWKFDETMERFEKGELIKF